MSRIARRKAVCTLKEIHAAGILHGDIRQENILVGQDSATLIDFTYAKSVQPDRSAMQNEYAKFEDPLGLDLSVDSDMKQLPLSSPPMLSTTYLRDR